MELLSVVVLLAAAVIAVPIFKRLGLGSVLGYLAAGIVIGPFGFAFFNEPQAILHVAELGVVMLLFLIGLEMKPSRLWSLRREIFGLGAMQVVVCGGLLTVVGTLFGLPVAAAFVAGMGFVLTSTAVVMQVLAERGETTEPHGQKIVSILLLEDLAIVPLLAIVAFLAPNQPTETGESRLLDIAVALVALAGIVAAGRYLLNPMFRILAASRAREIMTAAALLVVLGAAMVMELSHMSMAMGAFLAGVLLSESSFRHELEADIEPFRGLLLGLFFISVGMSLDLAVLGRAYPTLLLAVAVYMAVKAAGIYGVARLFRDNHADALRRSLLMAQGGEFAFVLYAAANQNGIFGPEITAVLNAAVIISMALTPLAPLALRKLLPPRQSFDGVDHAENLKGTALVIGFGRFGQVASQALLANGTDVSIIDNDTEMIRAAAKFGFKIYYGDGTRLDVLRASGAGEVRIIAVCVDRAEAASQIVELVKAEFPIARLLVRSFDRGHTLDLIREGVDFEIRETFESAMVFGRAALRSLDVEDALADAIIEDVRRRDAERLELQQTEGIYAGRHLFRPSPTPLTPPKRETKTLSEETDRVAKSPSEAATE